MTFILLCSNVQAASLVEALPESFQGYRLTERLEYTPETLFEYINGAAEMYLSYGLAGMKGCKYEGEHLPEVTVDIYEMTEPRNAYGAYTQSRDKDETTYGQGSYSYPEAILFWKDRYFIVISATQATPESSLAMRYLAKLLDAAIPQKGMLPKVVSLLPSEGLAPSGTLYFHHYVWLNAFYFIADFNILNINDKTDAVLAKYGSPEQRHYLMIVDYPDETAADAAYKQFMQRFAPEAVGGKGLQLEDKSWFAGQQKGKRIALVFNAPTKAEAENLLNHTLLNL